MRYLVLVGVLLSTACHHPEPNPTSPSAPPPSAVNPTRITIVATPGELPIGGGTARVFIETSAGSVAAPGITVDLQSSNGALERNQVTTDGTGHAALNWSGTKSSTLTASSAGLVSTFDLRVLTPPVLPPPSSPPTPIPTPAPTPLPPSPPALTVTLRPDRSTIFINEIVNFTAAPGNLNPGETVQMYEWDLNGDDKFEGTTVANFRSSNPYTTQGLTTAKVRLTTSSGRTATGTAAIVVTN